MNLLVKILIGIGVLIALLLIIALFVKKDYSVQRSITISKPTAEVFDYVRYVKNQDHFSKWVMADPNSKRVYKGTDGAEGFYFSWDSQDKNVGKGEQTISRIKENERVDYDLHFIKPFDGKATSYMQTDSVGAGQTKVTWGLSSKMPYPINIARLFINIEDILGKDLDTSLHNLKVILEKK